jgi:hypothetical protein
MISISGDSGIYPEFSTFSRNCSMLFRKKQFLSKNGYLCKFLFLFFTIAKEVNFTKLLA